MSTNLYKEAIAEAQQLKIMAEQNAKNKIIEALTPRIQAMVESQLLSEQEEIQFVDVEGDPALEIVADELIDEPEEEATIVVNAQGDVNLSVSETVSKNLSNMKTQLTNSRSSDQNKLAERIASLRGKVRRMDALLEEVNPKALSRQQRAVIKRSYQKLLSEAINLRSEAIVISGGKGLGLRLQIFETLKEMNIMTTKRSRAIFNQLFEAGYGELDEMELVLTDDDLEALGVDDAESADVDALDLEIVADIGEDEEEEDAEEAEGGDEEDGDEEEEVALDLGEVFEIDPRMLKMELRKLRRLREQEESDAVDMADQFGGGDVEFEPMEVDEEDLLNALADELGDPSVPAPKVESRRRRTARRNRRVAESRRSRTSRTRRSAPAAAVRENRALKQQLTEMNLFNAKLLYVNKLMQNRNVSSKQQRAIVEALDNAKTIREAKLVYEGLSRSLNKKSLSEGKRRVLGSSSKPTRSGSSVNESTQTDRWATLAGINNK